MKGLFNFTMEKQIKKVIDVEIGRIILNSDSCHPDFSQADVSALAQSYSENGSIQPISVRRIGEKFELIEGEMQFHAAKMCEFQSIPCVVYELNDRELAILSCVEFIKKQNLSFFEEATAIENLLKDYGLTQEEAAAKLGKAQSTIANKLRLLRLSSREQELISKYKLTERHARALLRLGSSEDRLYILEKVIKNSLNVEKTELLIENYIGKRKDFKTSHRRSQIIQNVSVFLTTINKTIEAMQTAGINAESNKFQGDEYVEYRVRIPMKSV